MATIKSFSDLEQSRKLAEILPIDSADMWYDNNGESIAGRPEVRYCSFVGLASMNIPCWSLAALLDVLPHRIDDRYALVSGKLSANEGWYVCYDDDNGDIDYYFHNSNLIDACYEMILKLHDQNFL